MDKTNAKLKVLMFPWLAQGHVSPYLELSKRLINKNFLIYFCSTPIILASLKEKLDEKQSSLIQLVELHLTSSPELPPHHHTTKDLPSHLNKMLTDSLNMAAPSFSVILEWLKPDLVIYDVFQPWAAALSSSNNIPAIYLSTTRAERISYPLHMMKLPEKEYPCRKINPRYFQKFAFLRGGGNSLERRKMVWSSITESSKQSKEIILVKTFEELEGDYLDYICKLTEKKVIPVGALIESPRESGKGDAIMMWLDKNDKDSTVFVSFGSECFLSKEEIEELALGLELSNVNFVWALRFPVGDETNADDLLPDGFLERVQGRGMVWQRWAPQMNILAHPSIGGFISHCGWGSTMESMVMGVPIIAMPMHLDQPYNAMLIEEVGFGIEVWRDENTGIMRAADIAKTIRKVMMDKDGECVRQKARELSDILRLKDEEKINLVVEELTRLCKDKT